MAKRYEGLFILNLVGKEDGLKEAVDRLSAEIGVVGGKVETVQKMEKRPFARVADRRNSGGHYVNIVFEAEPAAISQLQAKFRHSDEVFRILFTEAGKTPVPVAAAV